MGDAFQFLLKMTFTAGMENVRGSFGTPGKYTSGSENLNVLTGMKFDSSTKFFFCTDTNKVPQAYCEIIGFTTWYEFEEDSNGLTYFAGLYRIFPFEIPILNILNSSSICLL